jgi:hypothetical protein
MKSKALPILLVLTVSQTTLAYDGDVHGRDMTYTNLPFSLINFSGHMGLEKDGKIYNMLPSPSNVKTKYGQVNYLVASEKNFFNDQPKNKYWGAKYDYVVLPVMKDRIQKVMDIGADYSFYASNTKDPKLSLSFRTGKYTPTKGVYRCDTFVANTLKASGASVYPAYPSSLITPLTYFYQLPFRR